MNKVMNKDIKNSRVRNLGHKSVALLLKYEYNLITTSNSIFKKILFLVN